MALWPHQSRGIDLTLAAIARGERRVLLTSPTGGGKTTIMGELIRRYVEAGRKVILYTNRRWLMEQTSRVMREAGLAHGIRASGYWNDGGAPFQVSSVQTESSRVLKKKTWGLFDADLALVDEAHTQATPSAKALLDAHHAAGAAYVGVTATPMGLADLYETLVQAGVTSELRACGALVPATHYAPDEPDVKSFKKLLIQEGEDVSEAKQRKLMGAVHKGQADERLHQLYGRVLEWFGRINPERHATLCFAPGVAESIWFAEQFAAAGIPAAHIDGENVWLDGQLQRSTPERRQHLLALSRSGKVVVLCNRFVLREGIDAPWLGHGIFATVFGSAQSYLQSGGRLLRACPGKTSVTVQDHGGNWWRHGSLNEDRRWRLEDTGHVVAGLREERLREAPEQQPVRCPRCGMVRVWRRPACPTCGFELPRSRISRPVVQHDGTLREMAGDVYRPRRVYDRPDGAALWESIYWRAQKNPAKWDPTFRQAEGFFFQEHGRHPPRDLPLMPSDPKDLFKKIRCVPKERLTPKP